MKLLKKILVFGCVVFCLVGTSMTAFATEVKPSDEAGGAGTEITFSVMDKTGGISADNITVTFMNLETTETRPFEIQSANYLLEIPVKGWLPNGSYNIILDYPSRDDYAIENTDGNAITSFTADGTAHTFNWTIKNKDEKENITGKEHITEKNADTTEVFNGETGIEEADALWQAFSTTVAPIETDEKYASLLEVVDHISANYANLYEEVTGEDKQEYLDMSTYQQFLWCSAYILPVRGATASDRDSYTGSLAKWNSNSVGVVYSWLKTYGTQEMTDAYGDLMEWDYEYLSSSGGVYNFIMKESSLDNPAIKITPKDEASDHDSDPKQEEIDQLIKEEKGDDTEKGVWTDTVQLVKDNAISFILLFIVVGAAIGFIIYRKRKNIDPDKE